MVTCGTENCRNRAQLNEISGLCPKCHQAQNNPPPAYLASFPPAAMTAATNVSMDTVNKVADMVNKGETVDPNECMLAMFGMMASLHCQSSEMKEKVNSVVNMAKNNEDRIEALEKKVGRKEECAIPLSITIQNMPVMSSKSDEDIVKKVIAEVGAQGVDPERDVVKVERRGYKAATSHQTEKLGTVMVELSSSDVKARVMKAKKILESKPDPLSRLRIRNMKTLAELNQENFNRQILKMVPGGERFFIGANGALRPQQQQSHRGRAPSFGQHLQQQVRVPPPLLRPPTPAFFSSPPPAVVRGDNFFDEQ